MNTQEKITTFFAGYRAQAFEAGETILRPGENPDGLLFIKKGQVRQYDIAKNGDEIVVNVFQSGAHFPMGWLLNDETNIWYFEAISATTLQTAPKSDALDFFTENPAALLEFTKRLSSGASGQQRRMAHLMGGSAQTRVLYELIVEARRFAQVKSRAHVIEVSEAELAAKTGLSREAVSRELVKLKKDGLIERSYRRITIANLEKLEELLGAEI